MSESEVLRAIMAAIGARDDVRVFRNHVGQGWTGRALMQDGPRVMLADARRCAFGLAPGSSDIIGWQSVLIAPEMVGRRIARFLAIEAKGQATRTSAEQQRFIAVVQAAGGLAGIARSPADAAAMLGGRP
jgi:hypothetical protein